MFKNEKILEISSLVDAYKENFYEVTKEFSSADFFREEKHADDVLLKMLEISLMLKRKGNPSEAETKRKIKALRRVLGYTVI